MRTSNSQALEGFFRNPSVIATIASAGIHGMLVLFSGLKPAESVPPPLRIISLTPGSNTTNLNALLAPQGLPVPNGLPPINIGEVPELSALPNLSQLKNPSSQSLYLGSDPSSIGLGGLSIKNPPQKSVLGAQGPVFGLNLPKKPNQFDKDSQLSGIFSGNRPLTKGLNAQQDNTQYAVNPKQTPPILSPDTFQPDGGTSLPSPSATPLPLPSPSSTPTAPTGNSAAPVREKYTGWLQTQSQAYGKPISTKTGPTLVAAYPPSACRSKVESSALIAAVFGPDGTIAQGGDSIQVLQGAENLALTRAAISAVESYRFSNPSGIHQAYNFRVDIPYSAAVCNSESSPAPLQKPSAVPTPTDTPQPSVQPSPSPKNVTSKEDFLKQLKFSSPRLGASPLPSPSLQPTPNLSEPKSPEPLPSPSIALPEEPSKSP